jgi:peptide/nickel transport system permease protein
MSAFVTTSGLDSDGGVVGARSRLRATAAVFMENRLAMAGVVVVGLFILFCFVGPLLYHTNQVNTSFITSNESPRGGHVLGTDAEGYDILGRLMAGGQSALEVGVGVAVLATGFGLLWGAVAGYVGGWVDSVLMRIVDAALAIPTLFLLIFLAAIITPSIGLLIVVITAVSWMPAARLVRGEALTLRQREYVAASRGMGARPSYVVLRHIVPNTVGTIMVNGTLNVANAILLVAYLSFLGLGVPPPAASWGSMLSDGINYIGAGYWWEIYPAGACIVLIVVAFNAIGDGLRGAVEVRLQRR